MSHGVAAQSSVLSSRTLAPAGSVVTLMLAVRASAPAALAPAPALAIAAVDDGVDGAPGVPAGSAEGSPAGGCAVLVRLESDVIRNAAMPSTPPSAAATSTPTPIHAFDRGRCGS